VGKVYIKGKCTVVELSITDEISHDQVVAAEDVAGREGNEDLVLFSHSGGLTRERLSAWKSTLVRKEF